MSDVPSETGDMVTMLNEYLETADGDAARRFLDTHPQLYDPSVVAVLIDAANDTADAESQQLLYARAALLCGRQWSGGPDVVAALATAWSALQAAAADRSNLEQATATAYRTIEAIDAGVAHPAMFPQLLNLTSLVFAYVHSATSNQVLLHEAVEVQRRAVAATAPTSIHLPGYLNNLAHHLADLYEATTDRQLLDEAVDVARKAVAIPSAGEQRHMQLDNLAIRLAQLYAVTGERHLLVEAVDAAREAVAGVSPDRPSYPGPRNNLAVRLAELYHATSDQLLLVEAVDASRQAVAITPRDDKALPGYLNNLAKHVAELYAATGEEHLLEEAVANQRRAVATTAPSDVDLPFYLNNLAVGLTRKYAASGNRHLLDEAIEVGRRAVDSTSVNSIHLPDQLNNHANRLAELFAATGDLRLLDEAVDTQRRAVAATGPTSTHLSGNLNNLALRLGGLFAATGDQRLLDEAVAVAREAVTATPPNSTEYGRHLNNLSNRLGELFAATGDQRLLDEAVAVAREAVTATPPNSTEHVPHLNNLSSRLAKLYDATEERRLLDEAWELVDGASGHGPWERSVLARTRAAIVRRDEERDDRYRVAAQQLTVALDAFQHELDRPEPDLATRRARRRDLAQRVDGLLADLVASHVLAGDIDRAIRLLEGDRMWLAAPQDHLPHDANPRTAVAWIAASQWETTVVTTLDQRTFESHVINLTRYEIHMAVVAMRAPRNDRSPDSKRSVVEAHYRVVDALCELTGVIVAAIPQVDRLLIIPLGICALLPYTAAPRDRGVLIDYTTVTVAPSMAWARAATRRRPTGASVGAFHSGTPRLDLDKDREQFAQLVSDNVLDEPTADSLLAWFTPLTDIGHLSCHGAYNTLIPLDSWLDLKTELTIRAVLEHGTAPWLVNLSACETAVPDLQATEQLISFPTGFLLGGAAHVFATLWPVGNSHATAVNGAIYEQLDAGSHPADALRHAVQRLRGASAASGNAHGNRSTAPSSVQHPDSRHEHPLWWASFTHYGSPW